MLVLFKTDAYASLTMFGDVAIALLQRMGHSGTVPGALLAEDIPAALTRLRAAVAADPDIPLNPEPVQPSADPWKDDQTFSVSLSRRALPLIELLCAAEARQQPVFWENP